MEMPALTMPPPLWPHQERGLAELYAALEAGEQAAVLTAPTGGGKTRMICELVKRAREQDRKVVIYTYRRLLTSQTSDVLRDFGLRFGVMAAGYAPTLFDAVQIASIQTIGSRVLRQQKWDLHDADWVIVDEPHMQKTGRALEICRRHLADGKQLIGFSATPVDLGHIYKRIIVAGTNSELRACGALVRCDTYAPDEPNMRHVKRFKSGEYQIGEMVRRIMSQSVFGRVYDNWRVLNPFAEPTLLFGPDVPSDRKSTRLNSSHTT
jgi:superfamily II DNA or RNA helicase